MKLVRCHKCRNVKLLAGELSIDAGCGLIAWAAGAAKVAPGEASILLRLALNPGGIVPMLAIIEWLYGEREDGGPDDAPRAVWQRIHKLRHRLNAERFPGVIISHGSTRGYSLYFWCSGQPDPALAKQCNAQAPVPSLLQEVAA